MAGDRQEQKGGGEGVTPVAAAEAARGQAGAGVPGDEGDTPHPTPADHHQGKLSSYRNKDLSDSGAYTKWQYMTFSCHGGDGRAMVGLVVGDDTQGQGQGEDQEGADTQGQGQGRPVSPLGQ